MSTLTELVVAAAIAFLVLTAGAIAFQLALAAGAPWGDYAMGGRYPGRFPPRMRVAAVVQAGVLVVLGLIVATRAGMVRSPLDAPWLIWGVVAFSAASVVVNAISRSHSERKVWLPVALGLLASSLLLALVRSGPA
jgi:hypothetical protein